jgi:hypothetical protein
MSIIYESGGTKDRSPVFEYLKEQRRKNPAYKILDLGGGANPWCDEYADAYVDIKSVAGKRTFIGDIQSESLWDQLKEEQWDFCICTHVLEDIRNPGFVIDKIQRHFKAGFISMPNKHTEMSHVGSSLYLGYHHHRWIFTLANSEELRAIAKFPIVQVFSPKNALLHKLAYLIKLGRKHHPTDYLLKWLKPELVGIEYELAFIWENDFKFSYINDDFSGASVHELRALYIDDLSNGI